MFDVADGDVEEEVVFAGDVEDFDDFGEGVGQFSEALDGREPLVAEARTHTSPSIERSVLLRMGFSSLESKALVDRMLDKGLLAHGAGRLLLELAERKEKPVRDVGLELLAGELWDDLVP